MTERSPWTLPKRAKSGERSAKILDPAPVDAEVGVAEARGRSDGDDPLGGPKMKLEVVDEAEDRASALRVKIVPGLLRDLGARELRHGLPGGSPGLGGRDGEPKRRDLVALVGRVARDAVRRGRAGSEASARDTEICRAFAGTREKRHGSQQEKGSEGKGPENQFDP
jgi:hypothetical protein